MRGPARGPRVARSATWRSCSAFPAGTRPMRCSSCTSGLPARRGGAAERKRLLELVALAEAARPSRRRHVEGDAAAARPRAGTGRRRSGAAAGRADVRARPGRATHRAPPARGAARPRRRRAAELASALARSSSSATGSRSCSAASSCRRAHRTNSRGRAASSSRQTRACAMIAGASREDAPGSSPRRSPPGSRLRRARPYARRSRTSTSRRSAGRRDDAGRGDRRYGSARAVRRKVFAVVVVLTVVFLVLFWLGESLRVSRPRRSQPPRELNIDTRTFAGAFLVGLAMFATLFLGVVLAVFLTLGVVTGDAERGLLQPLVVRPIGTVDAARVALAGAARRLRRRTCSSSTSPRS